MEQKLNFWNKIARSFYPSFSKEVIKWRLREGLKYLALLLLLIVFSLSAWFTVSFYSFAKELPRMAEKFFTEDLKDFPDIKVEDGEVFSTEDPFLKEWEIEGEKLVFIVDTGASEEDIISGKYSSYHGGFFILKDEFVMKTSDEMEGEQIQTFPLEEGSEFNMVFNPEEGTLVEIEGEKETFTLTSLKIEKWTKILALISFPLLLVFLFIIYFAVNIFKLFFFSVFSLIVNSAAKTKLKYSQLLNIGIFSLTLPLFLETLTTIIGLSIPYFGFLNSLLYAGLLVAGISSCKGKEEQEGEGEGKSADKQDQGTISVPPGPVQ